FRDGARRADRAVRVDGEVVGRLDELGSLLAHRRGGVAGVAGDLVLHHLGGAHVLPQLGLIGQRLRFRPRGLERGGAADRVPFLDRNDAEEIALAHDFDDAGNALERAVVDAFELGANRRRAHDAAVQHAGHREVLHVGEAAGDLVGNVDARLRLADDLVILRRLLLHRLFGIERDREVFPADQLAVADLLAAARDHAVGDGEIARAELLGGFREQRLPRGRCGLAQLHAADLDAQAAPGRALIRRELGVAFHQFDARYRHVELVRHDLAERGRYAGAAIDLARVGGDLAGLVDRQEGIDLGERDRFRRSLRERAGERPCEREADDERAGADERVAAGNLDVHVRLPSQACAAARLTARTMRAWVPQ